MSKSERIRRAEHDGRESMRERTVFFIGVGWSMKHSSHSESNYVIIFVDNYTRFKVVKFVKKKSDTTAALLSLVADYITSSHRSYRSTAYGRIMVANLGENVNANWTVRASRTGIPLQARPSTTGWLNERLDYCERKQSP